VGRELGEAPAEVLGDLGDALGRLGGDGLHGLVRPEFIGFEEDGPEDLQLLRLAQVVQREGVLHPPRAGEVGVDLDALHVGDDEEGRVLQRLPVEEELVVGLAEVGPRLLVLPAEEALFPHVGPALTGVVLVRPLLEGEALCGLVHFGGGGVAHEGAEVHEVLLVGRALREPGALPLSHERQRVHEPPPAQPILSCRGMAMAAGGGADGSPNRPLPGGATGLQGEDQPPDPAGLLRRQGRP
jgi:hypothetical protein